MTRSVVSTQLCRLQCRARVVQLAPVAIVTDDAATAVDRGLGADAGARVQTRTYVTRVVPGAVGAVPARSALARVSRVTGRDAVALPAERLTGPQACVHRAALIAVESCSRNHTYYTYFIWGKFANFNDF